MTLWSVFFNTWKIHVHNKKIKESYHAYPIEFVDKYLITAGFILAIPPLLLLPQPVTKKMYDFNVLLPDVNAEKYQYSITHIMKRMNSSKCYIHKCINLSIYDNSLLIF